MITKRQKGGRRNPRPIEPICTEAWRGPGEPNTRQTARTPLPASSSSKLPPRHPAADRVDEEEEPETTEGVFTPRKDEEALAEQMQTLHVTSGDDDFFHRQHEKPPTSALEHFEAATRKEAQGNLGSSLDLYRKAYRLDSNVDQEYRKKHFPPVMSVPGINPSAPLVTVPKPAHVSQEKPWISTAELISSFAASPILGAGPTIQDEPPLPCPISRVPSEVLVEILWHVALLDPAAFGRLSSVCKRMAYHFAHEQHIWRRLCQGSEFGFGAMHYDFACDVRWHRMHSFLPKFTLFPFGQARLQIPAPLSSWSQVFQAFPRIRFTGIYISTVNYTRPGANSSLQNISWNTPIHIVTYYRYLRFYPDGSVISLLTTTEPVDVVRYISKENLETLHVGMHSHRRHQHHASDSAQAVVPVANPIPPVAATTLKSCLRGRWHLNNPYPAPPESEQPEASSASAPLMTSTSTPAANHTSSPSKLRQAASAPTSTSGNESLPDPRDLFIETEGVDPKYTYTMHLALRSASGGRPVGENTASPSNPSKNTKLMWKGFWSYNRLTDDWAEFGLRNDRAFVFRRVRGWGMG
ncbi:Pof7 F-box protein [Histoplasma capsulatum G186AR]|uniref:Pof7 F-box protein n=1 Tax=Ajellomyces capsulatus (strain G186AR / H82 / ATCC MYA-2454 / RMSCC 2432) TaxID=447093 RepID=C0NCQ9_AJECG|nr:Pof7 F-box protein [Histoplasma capsulatum G186AR]EEH11450.1 Pof7 F-box protein [Histoplasma capsulatum G186AR]